MEKLIGLEIQINIFVISFFKSRFHLFLFVIETPVDNMIFACLYKFLLISIYKPFGKV